MGDHADDAVNAAIDMMLHDDDDYEAFIARTRKMRPKPTHIKGHYDPTETEQPKRKKTGNAMNNKSLYAPIYDQTIEMVQAQFITKSGGGTSGTHYTYKARIGVCTVGDLAIAQAGQSFGVVRVTCLGLTPPVENDDIDYKWIVGVVNEHDFEHVLQWEKDLIEQIQRRRAEKMRMSMIEHLGVEPNGLTLLSHVMDDGSENVVLPDRDAPVAPQPAPMVDPRALSDMEDKECAIVGCILPRLGRHYCAEHRSYENNGGSTFP